MPLTRLVFGCKERTAEGNALTKNSNMSILFVVKKYLLLSAIQTIARVKISKVFIIYSAEEFFTLLITRLPSFTILGIEPKLLSCKTRLETFLAASLPDATETAQSASFIARISFTPSPVIATVLPAFLIERISIAFCSGVTRPKTVY